MKVACVFVTHLRAKVALRRQPRLKDSPAVIVARSNGRAVVVDYLPVTSGVSVGMTLEQALSRQTEIVALEADEPSYQRVCHQMLTSLQGISDRVEEAELGTAYVQLDGLEAMYGGEARLVTALLNAVPQDLNPRVGVANAKFPALVAALSSTPLGATRVPLDIAGFLAPYSIDLLPVSFEAKAQMTRFGLHTMGDVAAMKKDIFIDQFGIAGGRAWDLCNGIDDSPFVPLKHEESIVEHMELPFSSTSLELLVVSVDTLLKRAYSRPQMRGRYANRAALECIVSSASPWEKTVHFKQGTGSWERASYIIRSQLEVDHPQAPIDEVTVTLTDLVGESGVQMGLWHDQKKDRYLRLVEAERQLKARMNGKHALYKVVEVAPWHPVPEMRSLQVPVDPDARDGMKPISTPIAVEVREGPDRQPATVRLKKRWHQVTAVDDLWTVDLWWMPTPITRTYYRVRREDGRQTTLFRDHNGGCWYRQTS